MWAFCAKTPYTQNHFGSHANRLELAYSLRDARANAYMPEIEPTPIFQATRKRVGSVSRQNRIGKYVYMSFCTRIHINKLHFDV